MIPLICIRNHSQNISQPTGGKNLLIQSFTLTPRGATHCTYYKQTTFPQTFSTTPHDCAQILPQEFPAYHSCSPISKHLSQQQYKKATLPCVHPQCREKTPDKTELGLQQQIQQRHCSTTCEKHSSTSTHSPSVISLIGQFPYLLHLKLAQLVAPAEKDCQHPERAGGTNDS